MRHVLIVMCVAMLAGCGGERRPALVSRADELKHTVVMPHLDYPIKPGTNVLWCATMQVAWNELCAMAGEDIHMQNEDPMVGKLNKKTVSAADLNAGTYLATAGIVSKSATDTIRKELTKKFGDAASPQLLELIEGGGFDDMPFAYAYLIAELPFEWPFAHLKNPIRFEGTKVQCFGIDASWDAENAEKVAEQVLVYDYQNTDDFIVELKTKLAGHRLFLAKVSAEPTLKETIETVQKRVAKSAPNSFRRHSRLDVPVLDFDIVREYTELTGRPLTVRDPRLAGLPLEIAAQEVRFRLDERGAILKSEGVIALSETPKEPYWLVFDKPFLVMIQCGEGNWPYFALWVDNPEVLVPFR